MVARPSFVRPRPLASGDRVRVVAPAGRFAEDAVAAGRAQLARLAWQPEGPTPMAPAFACAGSIAARTDDLRRALAEAAPATWAARGGSGAGRLAARVANADWAGWARSRSWLVGFSDITALHARVQGSGLMSLHAANLSNLARWTDGAREELWALLRGSCTRQQFAGTGVVPAEGRAAQAEGPLLGGNLTVLASLAGCGVLPSLRGAVLLLEDVDEAPYRLARALGQLIDAGCLDGLAGVALGQWTRCDDRALGHGAQQWLLDVLAPLGVPIVAGLAIGHEDHSRPVVLGAQAALDARAGTLTVSS